MNFYYDSTILAAIDVSDQNYQFDIYAVFLIDGKKYWAFSAGCSCPTPFEEFTSVDQLSPLNRAHDFKSLELAVKSGADGWGVRKGGDYRNVSLSDVNQFMRVARS